MSVVYGAIRRAFTPVDHEICFEQQAVVHASTAVLDELIKTPPIWTTWNRSVRAASMNYSDSRAGLLYLDKLPYVGLQMQVLDQVPEERFHIIVRKGLMEADILHRLTPLDDQKTQVLLRACVSGISARFAPALRYHLEDYVHRGIEGLTFAAQQLQQARQELHVADEPVDAVAEGIAEPQTLPGESAPEA